ncbi:hypothetical protein B0H17DRAFT_254379 [Mycena rosella]|uniref:Uncharacterized protein n=1 Tax=Mycena rosella TaxID=1033263 RepID=A0AAD7CX63_MYCRO|nr:hypothetical protein B0H17DRAFT_254379 [Mycena rosella]
MSTVPSIRLIVPTPDVSAASFAAASPATSIRMTPAVHKKSVRTHADFNDIVRRVGGTSTAASSVGVGRGWEVRVDEQTGGSGSVRGAGYWGADEEGEDGGEGMVLIKKRGKTRGRVDGVFGDVTNSAPTQEGKERDGKDKWWNLTRGRKDPKEKEGKVLGFVRRGKSPAPSPTLDAHVPTRVQALAQQYDARQQPQQHPTQAQQQAQQPDARMQMCLPGEPDCTLDMVDVPSVRGRGVLRDLPPQQQQQPFPQTQTHTQKRYNSLGASSALASAPPAQMRPGEYQRSVSAGLLNRPTHMQGGVPAQYAHLPGAAAPYATLTRAETYTYAPPSADAEYTSASASQATNTNTKPQQHMQRSASALGVYAYDNGSGAHDSRPAPEFKRSASALAGLAGAGILLGAPASTLGRAPTPIALSRAPTPTPGAASHARSGTPTPGLLAPPGATNKDNQGSIALRAMRSVRSMARLGGWEKEGGKEDEGEGTVRGKKRAKGKEEGKDAKKEGKKKKEGKEKKEKEKERRAPKSSGSSFEVGALGTSPVQRKRSILALGLGKGSTTLGKSSIGMGIGLGLPSALSLGRSGGAKTSTASSVGGPHAQNAQNPNAPPASGNPNRLSAEALGSARRESTNSSLRPLSVLSSGSSAGSRVSSGSSVRWAEEVVDRVRGRGAGAEKEKKENKKEKETTGTGRESRRSSEGRRRTPLSDIFPGLSRRSSAAESAVGPPMLTVEEATTDGHGHGDEDEDEEMEMRRNSDYQMVSATPVKRARPRPVSDDAVLKSRPRGIIEDTPADGVLTLLDAATNDLAQLVTHLGLEATPGTPSPARGPIVPRKEWQDSPTGKSKTLRASDGSVSSLRPYATRKAPAAPVMLGQQIAPWPSALDGSPPPAPAATSPTDATFKRMHRRTMTPTPEPEPAPVFQPLRLRPSRIRPPISIATSATTVSPPPSSDEQQGLGDARAPSSQTFGSRSSSGSVELDVGTLRARGLPPVFTRGHARNRSSLLPDAAPSPPSSRGSSGMPLAREAKRVLGMGGTMGGSDASGYEEQELDASDPDSDIPDELQVLLSASRAQSPVDDTLSFRPPSVHNASRPLPSPGLPPHLPLPVSPPSPPQLELPVFNVELVDHDMDEGGMSSEEDTKKSFDFTGELQKLNESGGSDRLSFVEQLENAFKTPAKIDLRGMLRVEVPPPMPSLPVALQDTSSGASTSASDRTFSAFQDSLLPQSMSRLVDVKEPTIAASSSNDTSLDVDGYSASRIVDLKEPTLLPGSDSLGSGESLALPRPFAAGPSDGQLNVKFKFGGDLPEEKEKPAVIKKPLTLSDIIPPPSHIRSQSLSSLMEEDDSVLKSIFANAADIQLPIPRPRVNSDSSARRFALENSRASMISMHSRARSSRPTSGISFTGLDSFDEVRRGFEFHNNRPAFYPPPVASNTRRVPHGRQDSVFSIASVSSYGHVTNPGITDPFEYGLPMPSLRERPSSEDLSVSMSINVDDTFSFLGRDPVRRRERVESDASSFYFKAPAQPSARSGHRRRESNMSVSSQGPPVSFYNYNRSFGNQRLSENDTSTSGSSLAHQYATYGANGGRAAWAKHQQNESMDSVMSDYSFARLGRPNLGDKMFDADHGMPLSAISASPPESHSGLRNRSSFDSIIDEERRSSMEDSLFEKTGHRSSMSSDSVFGYDDHNIPNGHLLPPTQFRPLSMLSMNSIHSPMKEDDTMISMLGGGHVRRRSIGSLFEASPCVRVEKRKHIMFQDDDQGPNKARIVTKASIASTSSSKFGGERMIKATQGLLMRQSLEDSCLVAAGEDLSALRAATAPVFSRPSPNRSRSSTITTSSSGADTPPLSSAEGSSAEGSSMSEGSQSSIDIDMSQVNVILSNATHPMSMTARDRVRARARGHGHRRRVSVAQARASRSSVYETIQEEMASPAPSSTASKKSSSPTARQDIFIVDADSGSVDLSADGTGWDDERGIIALRKYYALRHEAEDTVIESKRMWSDTPFSVYALQAFQPPQHPEGMQALLQHSVQNYGPLPSELGPRRVRSRTQSRASPYPQRQGQNAPSSPELQLARPSPAELHRAFAANKALQPVGVHTTNVPMPPQPVLSPKRENAWGLAPNARPRVASATRRSALGWAKRSTKTSTDLKENSTTAVSFMMTPGESLRISRPRPRGRPTPARSGAATPRQPIAV